MPAATRQQADDEERAATAVALGEAQEQAEQAAAAEQAAKDALELERLAREEAEKAREALEGRLAALEASEESAGEEEVEAFLSGFCISFGSLEPLPDRLCLSSPPPRGSSFGVRRLWSKGFGGRPDSF